MKRKVYFGRGGVIGAEEGGTGVAEAGANEVRGGVIIIVLHEERSDQVGTEGPTRENQLTEGHAPQHILEVLQNEKAANSTSNVRRKLRTLRHRTALRTV